MLTQWLPLSFPSFQAVAPTQQLLPYSTLRNTCTPFLYMLHFLSWQSHSPSDYSFIHSCHFPFDVPKIKKLCLSFQTVKELWMCIEALPSGGYVNEWIRRSSIRQYTFHLKWKQLQAANSRTSGMGFITTGLWLQLMCCIQVSSLGVPNLLYCSESIRGVWKTNMPAQKHQVSLGETLEV